RLYGASPGQVLLYLRLPTALPYFLAGLRISGGLALIGAVVAEFVAGTGGAETGLAFRILEAGYRLAIPRLFAALFLLSLTGIVCTLASGVTVAMKATARATFCTSIVGSMTTSPLGCGTPRVMRCVISVSALPTSIWPHEMSYLRPSSEVDLVRPVTACLAVV